MNGLILLLLSLVLAVPLLFYILNGEHLCGALMLALMVVILVLLVQMLLEASCVRQAVS